MSRIDVGFLRARGTQDLLAGHGVRQGRDDDRPVVLGRMLDNRPAGCGQSARLLRQRSRTGD